MTYTYEPKGICAKAMTIEVEDGIIKSLQIRGGCQGNRRGISRLVTGMSVADVIEKLDGIPCGERGTSCPDQLAQALKQITNQI